MNVFLYIFFYRGYRYWKGGGGVGEECIVYFLMSTICDTVVASVDHNMINIPH